MASSLAGRTAIVTGGGQGVGRGIALALAGEGSRLAITGRTLAKCETVAAEIVERGGEAIALRCDVEQRDDVEATIAATVEHFGSLDIVVNNAQSMVYRSMRRLTEDDLDSMWQSGPMGTFRMMQLAFEHLRASQGVVINVGSGSSITPQPLMAGYAMAKESIRIMTRVAALEWGRHGIRVNAVCPLAESPGYDAFATSAGPGVDEQVVGMVPLGRIGDPETDVGRAVVFLCGPDAAYMTGTTLMLDGGYTHLR